MVIYDSTQIYIDSSTSNLQRIANINKVIAALEALELSAAAGSNISEYTLDNGQTKISQVFRSIESISASIMALERQKQRLINNLNGRIFRMVDSKNFTGRNGNGRF